jgi:hypothetical protein
MITQIYHKRNELFEVEFYKDKECTEAFDFTEKKNLYIELKDGDVTPLMFLYGKIGQCNLFVPFLPNTEQREVYSLLNSVLHARGIKLHTLSKVENISNRQAVIDNTSIFTITPNLSKHIPEDNAVLFLSGEKISLLDYDGYYNMFSGYRDIEFEGKIIKGMPYHPQIYGIHTIGDRVSVHIHEHDIDDYTNFTLNILKGKKLTIFLPHGTQSELQKAEEVAKYLWENFGIKPDLCVLHCFKSYWRDSIFHPKNIDNLKQAFGSDFTQDTNLNGFSDIQIKDYEYLNDCRTKWKAYFCNFNKIITTNSTGILKNKDSSKRLQVINCKEIFEEYLNQQIIKTI